MNSEIVEYVIQEVNCIRRTVQEETVNIEALAVDMMAAGAVRTSSVLTQSFMGQGPAAVQLAGGGMEYWSIRIMSMPLNCPFEVEKGIAHPVMSQRDSSELYITVPWVPPPTMRLMLGVWIRPIHEARKSWLIAYDDKKDGYQLPIGNIYEDCALCLGGYDSFGPDTFGVLQKTINQFLKSKWNSDLYSRDDRARRLFSFAPRDAGFEQIQHPKWTECCQKRSSQSINQFFGPL